MTTTVWFAHGKESGPWGRKITALARVARERGCAVESPDYRFTQDPDARVEHLLSLNPGGAGRLVLVGSSMGGYVSAVASRYLSPAGLWLLAPAVDMPGYPADTAPGADLVEVIHGWNDALISYWQVVDWSHRHGARLTLVPAGHTLSEQLPLLVRRFDAFLAELADNGAPAPPDA